MPVLVADDAQFRELPHTKVSRRLWWDMSYRELDRAEGRAEGGALVEERDA